MKRTRRAIIELRREINFLERGKEDDRSATNLFYSNQRIGSLLEQIKVLENEAKQ